MLFGKERVYEVMVNDGQRWIIDCVVNQRKQALAKASILVEEAKFPLVRVTFSKDNKREEIIFDEACNVRADESVSIIPIEEAEYCEVAVELHHFPARRTIGKILRKYLDNEGLTPSELVFNAQHIKQLIRIDRLSDMAMQRIATLQARERQEDTKKRIGQLYGLVKEAQEITEAIKPQHDYREMLEDQGLSPVISHINASVPSSDVHLHVGVALSKYMGEQRDWPHKIALVLAMIKKAPDNISYIYLDEALAEIIDSPQAVKDILGPQGELGSTLCVLGAIVAGKFEGNRKGEEQLLEISKLLQTEKVPQACTSFYSHIASALASLHPLTREGIEGDKEIFSDIISSLSQPGGICGGPNMAAALASKGRILMKDGTEDLPIAQALTCLMPMFPDEMTRCGYLLDLSCSTFGDKFRTVILRFLLERLLKITSINQMMNNTALPGDFKVAITGLTSRLHPIINDHPVGAEVLVIIQAIISGKLTPAKEAAVAKADISTEKAADNEKEKLPKNQKIYKQGEIIIKEGETNYAIYMVLAGEVDLTISRADGTRKITTLSRGNMIGEMSLIDNKPHIVSATAKTDCKVSFVPEDIVKKKLNWLAKNDPMLHHIIAMLTDRLGEISNEL